MLIALLQLVSYFQHFTSLTEVSNEEEVNKFWQVIFFKAVSRVLTCLIMSFFPMCLNGLFVDWSVRDLKIKA